MQPKGSQANQGKGAALGTQDDADSVLADYGDDGADAVFDGPPNATPEKLLDADFFNHFPDDFDEADMEVMQ